MTVIRKVTGILVFIIIISHITGLSAADNVLLPDIGVSAIQPVNFSESADMKSISFEITIQNFGKITLEEGTMIPMGIDYGDLCTVFEYHTLDAPLNSGEKVHLKMHNDFDPLRSMDQAVAVYTMLPGDNPFGGSMSFNDTLIWNKPLAPSELFEFEREKKSHQAEEKNAPGDQMNLLKMNVFPNPAKNILNIQIQETGASPVAWSVMDISGNKVENGVLEKGMNRLNISHIYEGIYILEVVSGDQKSTRKIQVTH